jgi:hypothetical protein
MATTPAGKESLALSYLKDTLAATTAWQTWTNTTTASAAKAYIGYSEHADGTYPFAVIGTDDFDREQIAIRTAIQKGSVLLEFYADISGTRIEDPLFDLINNTGAVIDGMMALANSPGMLNISKVTRLGVPFRVDDDEKATENDIYYVAYRVEYWGS